MGRPFFVDRWSQIRQPNHSMSRMAWEGEVLSVLVDYDNVNERFKRAGVIESAIGISHLIPFSVLSQYESMRVRLYGGWRENSTLTRSAQNILPEIRRDSPRLFSCGDGSRTHSMRFEVELADRPAWSTAVFSETFVKDRPARKFRARRDPWQNCAGQVGCGMAHLRDLKYSDSCRTSQCSVKAQDLIVRDEQKMVDTLLVADIAYLSLQRRDKNIVVVSSDTDMWPGVLLAANAGCLITHVHTNQGWKTQRHLKLMLDAGRSGMFYEQVSA